MSPCTLMLPFTHDTHITHTHLKYAFVQQSCSEYSDPLSADLGVKTSEQAQGVQFDTVQVEGHHLALHAVGYSVPPGRKHRGRYSTFLSLCNVKYWKWQVNSWYVSLLCVSGYPLAISQVDLPKGGVKLWRWVPLMILIEENGRTTNFQTQLLCSLKYMTNIIS